MASQDGAAEKQDAAGADHAAGQAKASELDPESIQLHLAMQAKDKGADLYKQQQFAAARDQWQQALQEVLTASSPGDVVWDKLRLSLHLNLCQVALQLKEYEEVLEQASLAIKIDVDNSKAYYRRGLANDALGKLSAAASDLQKAARIEPRSAEIRRKYEELKKKAQEAGSKDDDAPPEHDLSKLPRAFIDVAIGDQPPRRLVFALYTDTVPKTVENFKQLCTGEHQGMTARGKRLHYKGSVLHRMIPGLMVQGGDFENANGTGGESIYGRRFQDEAFRDKHTRRGLLAMANDGPNTNGSNFFVTFAEAEHLDRRHVVFGEVTSGMDLLDDLEALQIDAECRPLIDCVIIECGDCGPGGTTTAGSAPGEAG